MAKDSSQTISIVVPCVGSIEDSKVLSSYCNSHFRGYQVQFVFLLNTRELTGPRKREPTSVDVCDILVIYNDRYFGSCEENIVRVGDFIDLLGNVIAIVGEHDFIDWEELGKAADTFFARSLDAMAINISCLQLQGDGSFASLSSIVPIDLSTSGHDYVQVLSSGHVLGSDIAFPAMISCFGPMDWAAYIGSHLFTKEVFRRMLMLKYSENVYSLVYKQLHLFSAISCRYSYYAGTPLHRISSEFLQMSENRHSFGWLEDHRTVKGLSPCFWIAHLQYLVEIQNAHLFPLVTFSHSLSCWPGAGGVMKHVYNGFFRSILQFSSDVLRHKLNGRSYYFPDESVSCDLGDLHTVYAYFAKFIAIVGSDRELTKLLGAAILLKLENATHYLACYIRSMSDGDRLIHMAILEIDAVRSSIDSETLVRLCDASFSRYLGSLRMNPTTSPGLKAYSEVQVLPRRLARKYIYNDSARKLLFRVKCRLKPIFGRIVRPLSR